MNPNMGDLPFPRGVEGTGRKTLALPSLASARTGHSGNLHEKKLLVLCSPGKLISRNKAGKPLRFFGLLNGVSALRVRTGVPLRKGVDYRGTPVVGQMVPWFLLVPLQTVPQLSLLCTRGGVQWHQSSVNLFNHRKCRVDNTGGNDER